MSSLLIPPATQDFANDRTKLRVTLGIQAAIDRSFARHKMRHMTKAEVKRRFTLCFEAYRVMRNEEGWSVVRCIDHFDRVLDAALTGTDMDYSQRSSWYGAA